jgi:hypothetical protein
VTELPKLLRDPDDPAISEARLYRLAHRGEAPETSHLFPSELTIMLPVFGLIIAGYAY